MAADCEQTRARILELLYGELAGPARAEVDAHVRGCPDCKAELAALESTRALARRALAADAPPPRVRAAILQAAAAAVPARKPASTPVRPSLWARIRGKWTFPTFATVGAVAVFLLASRIFMEPEKTYQRGRQGVAPAVAPDVPAAAEERQPVAPAPADLKREAEEPSADLAAAPARHKPQPARRAGGRPPAAPAAKESSDDLLEGLAPAPETRAFAPPPPAARAQRKQEEQEERAPAASALDEDAPREAPGRAASGAGAPAPSAAPAAKRAQAPAAAEPPAVRADRLFAQRRWAEAALAYRDLLRDDPHNPDAPRWRQRLAACQAAAPPPP